MSWALFFLAAILAAYLLAGPAAAGIKRYRDSQGVIRISNVGPAKSRQIQSRSTAATPAAPETPREVTRPPQTGSPEAGVIPGSQQLRRVSYDPDHAVAAPSPAAQDESLQKPKVITEGDIRRFRNRQGVLVITNVTPKSPKAEPPARQTLKTAGPAGAMPIEQPDLNAAFPDAPGLKPVSWSPDQTPAPARPVATANTGSTAPQATGAIRRYLDEHGVMHIENVGTAPATPPNPPAALARVETSEASAPPAPGPSLPEKGATPPFIGPPEPVLLKEDNPMQILTAAASPQDGVPIHEGVRRYRDRLGIWRIETVDGRWLLEAPPLAHPAASPQQVIRAAARTAASLPWTQAAVSLPETPDVPRIPAASFDPGLPVYARLATPKNDHGISVYRDRQGRLVITNAPPKTRSGGSQSWMLASAQLEPIIQDAARAYRLPPSLIRAVIKVESNFVNAAVSPKGAMGLMQLMPGTADFLGVEEPFNPWQNIHGGCRYLRLLIDSFGGSLPLALAGYNAGPQRVVDSGYRVPDIKETQNFLNRVLEWYFSEEKKVLPPRT